jgi:hypothetical protein
MVAEKKKSLVEVKRQLAAKYEGLAQRTGSKPRQKNWFHKAARYRQQADQLERA